MALSKTPMKDAFLHLAPQERRGHTLEDNLNLYGIEKSKLDSTARAMDLETDIAEHIAMRVHELDKAEIETGVRPDMPNAFEDDEVTQFYVDELKNLIGDVGGMSRDMLKNQIVRMGSLMENLSDSSSEEKEFLNHQYVQSLTFLQNEYKNRSGIMSRSFTKMGDLAEQYMDVRSMYAGFVDNNPIAMALFRIAGDALSNYRSNRKAQKELIDNDTNRQFMAEKTEDEKHAFIQRDAKRAKELGDLQEDNIIESGVPETIDSEFKREPVHDSIIPVINVPVVTDPDVAVPIVSVEPVVVEPIEPVVAEPVEPIEPVVAEPVEPVVVEPVVVEPVVAEPIEPVVAEPIEPVITREEKVEGDAAVRISRVDESDDDRLDSEFRREAIEREDKMFEKVSDIHDLIETGGGDSDEETGGGILAALKDKGGPLIAMLVALTKAGLVALAGVASFAAGTWIYDKFIKGSGFGDWLGKAVHDDIERVKAAAGWLSKAFYNDVERVKSIATNIMDFFANFTDNITKIGDLIGNLVTDTFTNITSIYTDLTGWIGNKIESLKAMIPVWMGGSTDKVNKEASGFFSRLFGSEAEKQDKVIEKIVKETERNSNTVGITSKVAPSNMVSANDVYMDTLNIIHKLRENTIVQDEQYVTKNDLSVISNKNNLDAPVQKAQEEKIVMINQQVSDIELEREKIQMAVVGGGNITGKAQKTSVQSVGALQVTTPLTSARNPDSSIQRNTDKYYGRGMG